MLQISIPFNPETKTKTNYYVFSNSIMALISEK